MDITDLAGVRVTTYFADHVDLVAETLRSEFIIDESSSIDKRLYADPDRFGYQSLHYVVRLSKSRADLPENFKYADLKCEVQVRSILQHAWAEIEHDLGYKSTVGVPPDLRRRFARIAGLFELADDEFKSIREALNGYERSLPEKIQDENASVDLDLPSVRVLFSMPSPVVGLDSAVVGAVGGTLIPYSTRALDAVIKSLHLLGIRTVEDLERTALAEKSNVAKFAKYWLDGGLGRIEAGIGLFYLVYVLLWHKQDRQVILEYMDRDGIGQPQIRGQTADKILAFSPAS
ncbi:GTP pyrophosphokinase YjbM [compost metagenome]